MGQRVNGHDRTHPHASQDLDQKQSDGAAAEDSGTHSGSNAAEVDCVQRHPERFQEGRVGILDGVRKWREEPPRPGHQRTQPAVDRAVTGESEREAQVVAPGEAQVTVSARIGRVDSHALAAAWAGLDDARDLVTQDEWAGERRVADAALIEPVAI
jgi:hypothetical protein